MTMDYRISVIVPAYKANAYLEACVRSIVSQTHAPVEILIVDDGSPEPIADFLMKFDFFDRLRIYRLEQNQGVAGSRNAGLREAKGEWVAYLDHDDWWAPNKLEVEVAHLREHRELDGVDSGMTTVYPDGRSHLWGEGRRSLCLEDALRENQIINQMLLVKRATLLRAGGYDPSVRAWDDHAVSIRLAAVNARIDHLPQSLGIYHRHSSNHSRKLGILLRDGIVILWEYRALYIRVLGWMAIPRQMVYILKHGARLHDKIPVVGHVVRKGRMTLGRLLGQSK
jgi:glycosyltransferase involved in cell wall biosynthesis